MKCISSLMLLREAYLTPPPLPGCTSVYLNPSKPWRQLILICCSLLSCLLYCVFYLCVACILVAVPSLIFPWASWICISLCCCIYLFIIPGLHMQALKQLAKVIVYTVRHCCTQNNNNIRTLVRRTVSGKSHSKAPAQYIAA